MFTEKTKMAIGQVSGEVACDLEGPDASNPSIVAEVTLDANRLKMFGHPDADKEIATLVAEHGWEKVHKEAQKHVNVW